jgi:hypothetical protein
MKMLAVGVVAVLFVLAYFRFIARHRDWFMRSHRAYGEILELVDWEWERGIDVIQKIEDKFGPDEFSDFQIHRFLRLLVKDGKIEEQNKFEPALQRKIIEFRKLTAPAG